MGVVLSTARNFASDHDRHRSPLHAPPDHHRHHHHGAAEERHPPHLDEGADAADDGQPRIAGRAFTLRFVPTREDLATPASWSSPRSTRAAIEEMPEGCIAVIDAMGVTDAGVFGDILAQRMTGARRRRPRHRRRDARQGRRAGDRLAGVVRGRRGAAFGRGPHLRRLAGAGRLRRLPRSIPATWWWRMATARWSSRPRWPKRSRASAPSRKCSKPG